MTGSPQGQITTKGESVKKNIIILILALFGSATFAAPTVIHLEKAKSEVGFLAVGTPSAIKIRGRADDVGQIVTGTFKWEKNSITGSAIMRLDTFSTGIEMRDKHMKEKYLETQKFPQSELTLTKLELPDSATGEKFELEKIPFEGQLTLHGIKKPVMGLVDIKKKGEKAELDFDFKFPLSNFGIEVPTFMGIKVTDDVQVTVAVETQLSST